MRLNRFNDLPPRPDHIAKIRRALHSHEGATVAQLVNRTGLSRTAVLSALEALLATGHAAKEPNALVFTACEPRS